MDFIIDPWGVSNGRLRSPICCYGCGNQPIWVYFCVYSSVAVYRGAQGSARAGRRLPKNEAGSRRGGLVGRQTEKKKKKPSSGKK